MSADTPSVDSSSSTLESQLLDALTQRPAPIDAILGILDQLNNICEAAQKDGEKDKGSGFDRRNDALLFVCSRLCESGEAESVRRVLELKASWKDVGRDAAAGREFRATLGDVMKDRLSVALLDSVGFGTATPKESMRRLRVLLSCKPGAFCVDKTWGFGIVKAIDDFTKRITIDFEQHPGHTFLLSYAAEKLVLVGADHVLAVRHADPVAFEACCKEHPGEIVKLFVKSYGPMTVGRMEILFENHRVLPAGVTWRGFWSKARAELKQDETVVIPPANRKNDPVTIIAKSDVVNVGDAKWFKAFREETLVPELMARIEAYARQGGKPVGDDITAEEANAILKSRIEHIVAHCRAAAGGYFSNRTRFQDIGDHSMAKVMTKLRKQSEESNATLVRAVILANKFNLDMLLDTLNHRIQDPDVLLSAAAKLSARDLRDYFNLLPLETNEELANKFADRLDDMPASLVDDILPRLLDGPARETTVSTLKSLFSLSGTHSLALLLWIARNAGKKATAGIVTDNALVTLCLASLDADEGGERLRLQHLIARLFDPDRSPWLAERTAGMDDLQREALIERIHDIDDAWEPAVKRAIIAKIVELYPELKSHATRRSKAKAAAAKAGAAKQRITSWRSYRERQAKHRHLVEVEIPKNANDINVARGYGDLRENFEYQSAKDEQTKLMNLNADLEQSLKEVNGTDFVGFPADKAGIGTKVTLRMDFGKDIVYHILGEWDSDEQLRIISSGSRLAQAIDGHVAGDAIAIPYESGEASGILAAVEPLPQEILDWAVATPSAE